jgi:hypothetical protein
VLPSGLPEGPIVLGFVGTLKDMNPGSTMQVVGKSHSFKPKNGFVVRLRETIKD